MAKVHLLDIEGTTSSIAFVHETLFPYVRKALPEFLGAHGDDKAVRKACVRVAIEHARDAQPGESESGEGAPHAKVLADVYALMDSDAKSTGLKELQGLVSREGYKSGELRSHFYPDVPRALERWIKVRIKCCVYSSGSIRAQKSFYRYAEPGDLSRFIAMNFDTTSGPKREAASYAKIAKAMNYPASEFVFFSDVVEELDAARSAGMGTLLVVRPGNKAVTPGHGHREIVTFDEV